MVQNVTIIGRTCQQAYMCLNLITVTMTETFQEANAINKDLTHKANARTTDFLSGP